MIKWSSRFRGFDYFHLSIVGERAGGTERTCSPKRPLSGVKRTWCFTRARPTHSGYIGPAYDSKMHAETDLRTAHCHARASDLVTHYPAS